MNYRFFLLYGNCTATAPGSGGGKQGKQKKLMSFFASLAGGRPDTADLRLQPAVQARGTRAQRGGGRQERNKIKKCVALRSCLFCFFAFAKKLPFILGAPLWRYNSPFPLNSNSARADRERGRYCEIGALCEARTCARARATARE